MSTGAALAKWLAENREKVREYHRKYAQTEKGRANTKRKNASPARKIYSRKWREQNLDRANEATRRNYWKNVEVSREKQNVRHQANPAWSRSRLRRLKQATPVWVDRKALIAIYDACPPGYEVDHVIPIVNKLVCGLHVPWNLQYLPMRENRSKHNMVISSSITHAFREARLGTDAAAAHHPTGD